MSKRKHIPAISRDWHIHSLNSCDDAGMTVSDLVCLAAEKGIRDFGLTDHIHTPFNLPDIAASSREFLTIPASPNFHFGVEVSCVSLWELDEIAAGRLARQKDAKFILTACSVWAIVYIERRGFFRR